MILFLGGSGYVGSAFRDLFARLGIEHLSVSRRECDYTRLEPLARLIEDSKATFLVNAASYTGKPNVDACETDKAACLAGNAMLPGIIREACDRSGLPSGHVSSGCIYTGVRSDGSGFTETDQPNFYFRTDNCSFYSGTNASPEPTAPTCGGCESRSTMSTRRATTSRNCIATAGSWTLATRFPTSANSLKRRGHVGSRGCPSASTTSSTRALRTRDVVALIQQRLQPDRDFDFFASEDEFLRVAAQTPRSNRVMANSKLRAAGVVISHVYDALERAIENWQAA